jgi:hypothetical protein
MVSECLSVGSFGLTSRSAKNQTPREKSPAATRYRKQVETIRKI